MFEESVSSPSIWASMNSWFTPTVLFVLLNLMIGTIFFSSTLSTQQHQHQHQQENQENDPQQPKIQRSPSVLQRLKSINLYSYRSQEPLKHSHQEQETQTNHQDSQAHYLFEQTHQETKTHYGFQQTHNQETTTLFGFDQTHHPQTLQNLEKMTLLDFDQTHLPKNQETNTLLDFEQTHLLQTQETNTHFDFEQTHHPQTLKENTLLDFEQTHQPQNLQTLKENTLLDFEQTHLATTQEKNTRVEFTLDEVYSQVTGGHVSRTTSDTKPASGEVPAKLPTRMRKSASVKSPFGHFEENDVVEAETRRPATVRERRAKVTEVDDVEVDAKADDFINKFKQQLKLQRMDSIMRYKEMVGKGGKK